MAAIRRGAGLLAGRGDVPVALLALPLSQVGAVPVAIRRLRISGGQRPPLPASRPAPLPAASPASALELLGDRAAFDSKCGPWPPPVVILLDINMPQMGGFEFLEEIDRRLQRGELGSDSFTVTMHTSSSDPGDIDRARRHTVVMDYLMKPLSVEAVSRIAGLVAARIPQPSGELG